MQSRTSCQYNLQFIFIIWPPSSNKTSILHNHTLHNRIYQTHAGYLVTKKKRKKDLLPWNSTETLYSWYLYMILYVIYQECFTNLAQVFSWKYEFVRAGNIVLLLIRLVLNTCCCEEKHLSRVLWSSHHLSTGEEAPTPQGLSREKK